MTDETTKDEEISGAETPKEPRKIIPAEGWAEIIGLRERGQASEEAAACVKWGVTGKALSQHIFRKRKEPGVSPFYGKRGWRVPKLAEMLEVKPDTFETKRDEYIEATKRRLYQNSEGILVMQTKIHREVLEGHITIDERDAQLKTLNRSADITKKMYDVRRGLLGMDRQIDEATLTVLQTEDLSQPEIEKMRSIDPEDEDAFDSLSIEDMDLDEGSGEVVET